MNQTNFATAATGLTLLLIVATGSGAAQIETVFVGNAGNRRDVHGAGFGAVEYNYRIGKYEVTNAQYVEFLNSVDPDATNMLGLYNSQMASDARGGILLTPDARSGEKYVVKPSRERNPVILVSWYDAIRFANWLHNGQGDGDTETGAYTILGGTSEPTNGTAIARNPEAIWFLPTEDEWYKAAYHKNDGVTANYWDYPTATDAEPFSDQPPALDAPRQSNSANFYKQVPASYNFDVGYAVTGSGTFQSELNYLTDVGAYALSASPYGTFDQAGNVWEWNEDGSSARGARGGFWSSTSFNLRASQRSGFVPAGEFNDAGFRVATIPEPGGILLCWWWFVMALRARFRRH